jgi:hypothetical protein
VVLLRDPELNKEGGVAFGEHQPAVVAVREKPSPRGEDSLPGDEVTGAYWLKGGAAPAESRALSRD